MILPSSKDAIHRGQLYRLLIGIADDAFLTESLVFKGGTCAALLNKLDRFSKRHDPVLLKIRSACGS